MALLCTYRSLYITGRKWSTCDSAMRGCTCHGFIWYKHAYCAHTFLINVCSCQTGPEDFTVQGIWTFPSPCIKLWNSSQPMALLASDMVKKINLECQSLQAVSQICQELWLFTSQIKSHHTPAVNKPEVLPLRPLWGGLLKPWMDTPWTIPPPPQPQEKFWVSPSAIIFARLLTKDQTCPIRSDWVGTLATHFQRSYNIKKTQKNHCPNDVLCVRQSTKPTTLICHILGKWHHRRLLDSVWKVSAKMKGTHRYVG